LRRAVLKALSERPLALLIDLNHVIIRDPVDLVVLPTLDRRASLECGLRLQCYVETGGPTGRLVRELLGHQMSFHPGRKAALAAGEADGAQVCRAHLHLPADAHSAAQARAVIADLCRRWGIPKIVDDAQLIVSELVTNAVQHARTEIDLIATLRDDLLHLQVRDQAYAPALFPVEPLADLIYSARNSRLGGRGLLLVAALSTACGTTIGAYGKTVWASLRVQPDIV
jgi:anti-sigma regulatory factor (Ser/Thr protein kinase)